MESPISYIPIEKWINISFIWIKAIKGDHFPTIDHDSSEGEQWGRDQI